MSQDKFLEQLPKPAQKDTSPSLSSGSLEPTELICIPPSHPSCVTLEEIAPDSDTISAKDIEDECKSWHGTLWHRFHACKQRDLALTLNKNLPKNIRRYYKEQNQLLESFESIRLKRNDSCTANNPNGSVKFAIKISLLCNVLLLIAKAVASYLSGSMSIISSVVDSAVDLASGVIIWYTNRSIKGTNFYDYPQGKARLEPLGIVVLSVVMTVASVQLIITSVTKIAEGTARADISITTIIIISATILVKIILFLYCRTKKTPSTAVLSQDHRNDVLSNAVALGFGYLGYKVWKNADPIGAILISLYIAFGWWRTGREQIQALTGHTAQPALLQKLLWICLHHDRRVQYIDTLRAYHFGYNLLVEVHIVLPQNMTLQEAHDIGEPLQQKLEKFPKVERAFVHIDYEFEHHPSQEHKIGHPSLNEEGGVDLAENLL